MGVMKQWLLEEAEREYEEEIRQWYYHRTGRRPRKITSRMVEDFEFEEAWEHAMSKDN